MHGPIIGPTSPRCHQRFSLAVRVACPTIIQPNG
jgi:hypothetical protein